MTMQQLNEQFPIRRSKQQKADFGAWFIGKAQEMGYAARTEGIKEHNNLVVGDPLTAQMTVTAHYDTPARGVFANRMMPRSPVRFWLRQIGMIFGYIAMSMVVGVPVGILASNVQIGYVVTWAVYMALVLMMLYGPANKHNVNDNTSGVAAILEAMARIPADKRDRVAFILFDNEEKGCCGSKAYAKAHKDFKRESLVLNLDCVGDGEHLLVLCSEKAKQTAAFAALQDALVDGQERQIHHFPLKGSVYNSDQKNFDCAAAICACHLGKGGCYYTDRIHTKKDTVCEQANLDVLAEGIASAVQHL